MAHSSEVATKPAAMRSATGIQAMGFLELKRSGVRGEMSQHSAKFMKSNLGKIVRDSAKSIASAVPILPGKSLRPNLDPDAAVAKMQWTRYLFVLSATGLNYYKTKHALTSLFKEQRGTILREDIAGMYVRAMAAGSVAPSDEEGDGSESAPNSEGGGGAGGAGEKEFVITLKLKKMKLHEKMAKAVNGKLPANFFENSAEMLLRAPNAAVAHKWLEVLSGTSVLQRSGGSNGGSNGEPRLVPDGALGTADGRDAFGAAAEDDADAPSARALPVAGAQRGVVAAAAPAIINAHAVVGGASALASGGELGAAGTVLAAATPATPSVLSGWQLALTLAAFNLMVLALALERREVAAALGVIVNARLTAHWWAVASAPAQASASDGALAVRGVAPSASSESGTARRLTSPARSAAVGEGAEKGASPPSSPAKPAPRSPAPASLPRAPATKSGPTESPSASAVGAAGDAGHARDPSDKLRDPMLRMKRSADGRLVAGSMCMRDDAGPMSWTDGVEGCDFQVRSKGYKDSSSSQYKEKVTSEVPFYTLEGVDCTRTEKCVTEIGDKVVLPAWFTEGEAAREARGEVAGPLPRMLVVNVALPLYSTWTGSQTDGPSAHKFMYFRLRDEYADQMMDEAVRSYAMLALSLSRTCFGAFACLRACVYGGVAHLPSSLPSHHQTAPAGLQLLIRFFKLASNNRDAAPLLKIIMMIDNIDELGLPSMVNKYNGKPALQRSAQVLERDGYFEILINVHIWAQMVRALWARYRGLFAGHHLRVGLLVEGNDETELPEQMMLAVALHQMDWDAFPKDVITPRP